MTPKEKALELTEKYIAPTMDRGLCKYFKSIVIAKECALISVEEIIMICAFNDYKAKKYFEHCSDYPDYHFMTYWEEVKQEILNL